MDVPTREIFWAISGQPWFYGAAGIGGLIFLTGVWGRLRFIQRGPSPRLPERKKSGLRLTFKEIVSHGRFARHRDKQAWHLLVFYSFAVLTLVTLCLMLAHYGLSCLYRGAPYLVLTLFADLAGAALLAGSCAGLLAGLRGKGHARTTARETGRTVAFLLLALLSLSGFLLEGLRIHAQGDPWQLWSPFGAATALLLSPLAGEGSLPGYQLLWCFHAGLVLGLLAWIPFSSGLRHLLFLPLARSAAILEPRCALPFIDLEGFRREGKDPSVERIGIRWASDATSGQRLGMLACMDCGLCEETCPAFQSGQILSPRRLLQDLRNEVQRCDGELHGSASLQESMRPASEAVSTSALWDCRLCLACEEACPAGIEHAAQIMELRRGDVLGRGHLPHQGAAALRNLARSGNPYNASPAERSAWAQAHAVPLQENEKQEPLLLWTGCFPPGDTAKPRALTQLVLLLRYAGIPFFVLDDPLPCCGDPARILGEEDLFQSIAGKQIQKIHQSGAGRVLVHCPHCYTVLKDVYPLLGARFTPVHTSAYIQDLMKGGRLKMNEAERQTPVVYHDPCYLGRYQDIHEVPRQILESIPGIELREAGENRKSAFCCGAGGGHFFMDLDVNDRPADLRLAQVLSRNAETLAVSCNFCCSMLDEALRRLPEAASLEVKDWLELLGEACDSAEGP